MKVATFGMGKTLCRVPCTFRADDRGVTKVTVLGGQAPEDTGAAMGQWAAANAPT